MQTQNEKTYQLMREMNETLSHELGDVKRCTPDSASKLKCRKYEVCYAEPISFIVIYWIHQGE